MEHRADPSQGGTRRGGRQRGRSRRRAGPAGERPRRRLAGGGVVTGFVSLLPHRNDWTEQERDAVRVIEHAVHRRGFHRRGDVAEVPLTLSYIQTLLRKTGA